MFQYCMTFSNNPIEVGQEIERLAREGWRVHTYHTGLSPTNLGQLQREHIFLLEKEVAGL